MRRWVPARNTEASSTRSAFSCFPMSRVLRGLFLKTNDEVDDRTASPSISERFRITSSVSPSTK